ncbi:MAG: M24 family metallopeptidase [Candidatus Doudnabacteria bacterium]
MHKQKTSKEIKFIQTGSRIIDEIFRELLVILRSHKSATEISLANKIRSLAKKLGSDGMAFPPIVSFGSSSAEIHHKPSKKKIGKNNFLMLDYGVKVHGYCSDFTRTLFIGRPNKLHEKIYEIVLRAQLAAIKKVAQGKFGDEIDFAARHIINQAGFGKNYIHGTGHGVGKKIHEAPNFKATSGDIIIKNDVVTIEPGIYLPNRFGVRIEDMVLVSKKSTLFSGIPKDFKSMIVKI